MSDKEIPLADVRKVLFYLFTLRVVKHGTGKTGKYEPRTENHKSCHISGPFGSFKMAQTACVKALGTHTCIESRVMSEAHLKYIHSVAVKVNDYGLARAIENLWMEQGKTAGDVSR